MKLKLDKPVAFLDIESTGLNRKRDRLIDLAIVKLMPDGQRETITFRVNPGMPIPAEVTAIHGIGDADVKDCPPFSGVAREVLACLAGCDLGGYNLTQFDIPLLQEECLRVGLAFDLEGRRVLDVQRIYHKKEPRDLSAALAFYCGETHTDAHGALPDVLATIKVLEGQFERYADLPSDMDALHEFCNPNRADWLDQSGRLRRDENGDAVINFGQNQGRRLKDLVREDPGFLHWILKKDFASDTQSIVRNALGGRFGDTQPELTAAQTQSAPAAKPAPTPIKPAPPAHAGAERRKPAHKPPLATPFQDLLNMDLPGNQPKK